MSCVDWPARSRSIGAVRSILNGRAVAEPWRNSTQRHRRCPAPESSDCEALHSATATDSAKWSVCDKIGYQLAAFDIRDGLCNAYCVGQSVSNHCEFTCPPLGFKWIMCNKWSTGCHICGSVCGGVCPADRYKPPLTRLLLQELVQYFGVEIRSTMSV